MQKKHDIAKILFRFVAGLYGFISEVSVTFSDGIERVLSSGGCSPAPRFPQKADRHFGGRRNPTQPWGKLAHLASSSLYRANKYIFIGGRQRHGRIRVRSGRRIKGSSCVIRAMATFAAITCRSSVASFQP